MLMHLCCKCRSSRSTALLHESSLGTLTRAKSGGRCSTLPCIAYASIRVLCAPLSFACAWVLRAYQVTRAMLIHSSQCAGRECLLLLCLANAYRHRAVHNGLFSRCRAHDRAGPSRVRAARVRSRHVRQRPAAQRAAAVRSIVRRSPVWSCEWPHAIP